MQVSSEVYPILRGEFVLLRGPSGGGKTTLLNIIGCIDVASSGTLRLFGAGSNVCCTFLSNASCNAMTDRGLVVWLVWSFLRFWVAFPYLGLYRGRNQSQRKSEKS